MDYKMNNLSAKYGSNTIDSVLYDALGETYNDIVEVIVTRNNNCIVIFNDDAVRQVVFNEHYNVLDIIVL